MNDFLKCAIQNRIQNKPIFDKNKLKIIPVSLVDDHILPANLGKDGLLPDDVLVGRDQHVELTRPENKEL